MKYAFVTISIIAIWISIVLIILALNYQNLLLPFTGLIMTLILFYLGFGGNR